MKPKPVIPLSDYLRIFRVIKSVLDSVDAHTTHACMFFSIAGAAILREYYKKDAMQIAGAAFYLVDGKQRNAMSFATVSEGQAQSSDTAFHSWVQCDGYVIDFMTPIFPDVCVSSGHPFTAPGRMFQKRLSGMAPSHQHLYKEGDFYLVPNPELTVDLRRSFLQKPASADLVNICLHWYRKPPKPILPELHMQNDLGEVTQIKLSHVGVSGAW
ncbi:DUF2026 family protein [Polaromonas jejuensis]|uniref:DUF2026 family protein n=1 Tax=Polaromonas jejuensis TaxID=457502 RepID=A0ABW0QCC7_9BURK|nr:DUF2026 family protein [Polaromonas jejuensis]